MQNSYEPHMEQLIYEITEEENNAFKEQKAGNEKRLQELLIEAHDSLFLEDTPEYRKHMEELFRELEEIGSNLSQVTLGAYYRQLYLNRTDQESGAGDLDLDALPGYYLWADKPARSVSRDIPAYIAMLAGKRLFNQGRKKEALELMQLSYRECLKLTEENDGDNVEANGFVGGQIFYFLSMAMDNREGMRQILQRGISWWYLRLRKEIRKGRKESPSDRGIMDYYALIRKLGGILLDAGEVDVLEKEILSAVSIVSDVVRIRAELAKPAGTSEETWQGKCRDMRAAAAWLYCAAAEFYLLFNRFDEALKYLSMADLESLAVSTTRGVDGSEYAAVAERWRKILRNRGGNGGSAPSQSFFEWTGLRGELHRAMRRIRDSEGAKAWKTPADMTPEYWTRIHEKAAANTEFEDLIGFLDESPFGDGSRGIVISTQGIYMKQGVFSEKTIPWQLIKDCSAPDGKTLSIIRYGTEDIEIFHTSGAKAVAALAGKAEEVFRESGHKVRNAIPVPEEGTELPEALLQRFGMGENSGQTNETRQHMGESGSISGEGSKA